MTVINNIPNTTYNVEEDLFGGATTTLSCESGYIFDSAPTVTYTDTSGSSQTKTMTLNDKKTVASYDNEEIDVYHDITFNGSVSGGTPEPVKPNNNVAHTTALMEADKVTLTCDEGYIFDGSPKISFDDDPFADEVTMTVSQDGKTATYSQADLGSQQITITGKTKAAHVDPVVTNNVANTTVNVSGDTVTLTCADGYIFDGTPKVTLDNDPMADEMPMTVSGNNKTATLTSQGIGSQDITITGKTKTEPVAPVVTNNVAHTTVEVSGNTVTLTCDEGYIFDGVPVVKISDDLFTKPMTVSGDNKTATFTSEGVGSNDITITGNTKTAPVVTNNVAHTTVEVSGNTVTLTCDNGYIFDGVPVVTIGKDLFAETKQMSVTNNGKLATLTSQGIGSQDITITGNTKTEPIAPVVTNNVAHTTYDVSGDTLTLTCQEGYIFDGAPVVTKGSDNIPMTVSQNGKVATLTSEGVGSNDITITGNTKVEPEPEPTPDPVVTNNIEGASEVHTKDGATALTITLTSNKMMRNVTVSYTNTSGESVSLPVTVVVSSDYGDVDSTATVSLNDVDFNVAVVLSGETKFAIHITYTLSGCHSTSEPHYLFLGEPLSLTLTADEGNEFTDPTKVYYMFEGAFADVKKYLFTVSEDKLTATATVLSNSTDNLHLNILAEAMPKVQPTTKYGFINAYVVTEENLNKFATSRFIQYVSGGPDYDQGGGTTVIDRINYDLGDYVNRVKRYFFKVDEGSTSKLKCGNFIVDTDVKNLLSDRKIINFGDIYIPNYTQSNADYSSDVMMFVPFVGIEKISSEIIGKTVNLTLKVNVLSGDGVYVLTCGGNMVWSKEVAPCTDVIYRTSAQGIKVIGGINFDATFLMGLRPYVLVDRREIVNNGSQSPSSLVSRIGDLTGNVKLTDVVFPDTENMLQYDIDEIVSILRQGISL